MSELHVAYVVVHPRKLPAARLATIVDVISRVPGLSPLAADGQVIAFRRSESGECRPR
jgi:hypothetical protein